MLSDDYALVSIPLPSDPDTFGPALSENSIVSSCFSYALEHIEHDFLARFGHWLPGVFPFDAVDRRLAILSDMIPIETVGSMFCGPAHNWMFRRNFALESILQSNYDDT